MDFFYIFINRIMIPNIRMELPVILHVKETRTNRLLCLLPRIAYCDNSLSNFFDMYGKVVYFQARGDGRVNIWKINDRLAEPN